jgi:hypothetical protein
MTDTLNDRIEAHEAWLRELAADPDPVFAQIEAADKAFCAVAKAAKRHLFRDGLPSEVCGGDCQGCAHPERCDDMSQLDECLTALYDALGKGGVNYEHQRLVPHAHRARGRTDADAIPALYRALAPLFPDSEPTEAALRLGD